MDSGPALSGIILAGGESRRLGADKALLELGGQTLLENVIGKVSQVSQEVIVVANAPPRPDTERGRHGEGERGTRRGGEGDTERGRIPPSPPLPLFVSGLRGGGEGLEATMVSDVRPGQGALGGIYSGLLAASHFHSLVIACDMPFLNLNLLRYMALLAPGYDVVIPCVVAKTFSSHRALGQGPSTAKEEHLHPLHAIYSKRCLGPIEELLDRGDLRIIAFFPQVRVRYVEQEEVDPFDPQHLSLFNINTSADMERAKAVIADGLRGG
jgi:molybdopterin-guanine dinucleotide biosynthesis protein A